MARDQVDRTVDALLAHIRTLRQLHRSGEQQRSGDIEELFACAEALEQTLERPRDLAQTTPVTAPTRSPQSPAAVSGVAAARVVVEGAPEAVAATLKALGRREVA